MELVQSCNISKNKLEIEFGKFAKFNKVWDRNEIVSMQGQVSGFYLRISLKKGHHRHGRPDSKTRTETYFNFSNFLPIKS